MMRAALLVLALASTAFAQPIEGDAERARQLFDEAMVLLNADRFAEARDVLQESLSVRRHPASAFNLALALKGTGQVLDAVDLLERLLQGEFGEVSDAGLDEARRILDESQAEVGRLEITACGAEEITVRVDGERAAMLTDCETRVVEVDPGRRVVLFYAHDADPIERSIEVGRGERESLRVEVVVQQRFLDEPGSRPSVARKPWFWIVVVGVVGAGVAATFLLRGVRNEPLVTDDVGRTITALSF